MRVVYKEEKLGEETLQINSKNTLINEGKNLMVVVLHGFLDDGLLGSNVVSYLKKETVTGLAS